MEQNPLKRNLISFFIALGLSIIAISLTDTKPSEKEKKKIVGNDTGKSESFSSTASFFFD